ncbi:MAG: hypothetical protein MUE46_15490 [Xanthomonadales bacterium]|jgi:hypothetical protein|nr:hypothetical protein [Xanthomonadales bacterium]
MSPRCQSVVRQFSVNPVLIAQRVAVCLDDAYQFFVMTAVTIGQPD